MIPFFKICIIGSGNVSYTFSNVLKNNGINPKYILIRNVDKIPEVESLFGVETVADYDIISAHQFVAAAWNKSWC